MKKAFTLAEVMITLTIIGVISAIVVPVAFHSRPDENVMRFKKANNTLYQVIQTLVSSDKYYKDGDLAITSDGRQVYSDNEMQKYFCNSMADLLSTKTIDCVEWGSNRTVSSLRLLSDESPFDIPITKKDGKYVVAPREVTPAKVQATKEFFDSTCKIAGKKVGPEIITTDGIVYYGAGAAQFGSWQIGPSESNGLTETIRLRYFSPPNQNPANFSDQAGNDISYKIFCMDVDGIPNDVTTADCKNECPFGYGIRADGKIMTGARADEWLQKDIQGEN